MKRFILMFMIATGAVACSKDGGGGGTPAVGPDAKGIGALSGLNAAFETSKSSGQQKAQTNPNKKDAVSAKLKMAFASISSAKGGASEFKTKSKEKGEVVNKAISGQDCKFDVSEFPTQEKTFGQAAQFPKFELKVVGEKCPVLISLEMNTVAKDGEICRENAGKQLCKFIATAKLNIEVKEELLQKDLEMKSGSYNFKQEMEETINIVDGSENAPPAGFMDMSQKATYELQAQVVDLDGVTHSVQASDKIDFQMGGNEQAPILTASIQEELGYSNSATGGGMRLAFMGSRDGSGKEVVSYAINGTQVSKESYLAEREKFVNSLMSKSVESGSNEEPPSDDDRSVSPPPVNKPANEQWSCIVENSSTFQMFIGYGRTEGFAAAMSKEACKAGGGSNFCSASPKCNLQESRSDAWFCTVNDASTGITFTGYGASRFQAMYSTQVACIDDADEKPSYFCKVQDSDCYKN